MFNWVIPFMLIATAAVWIRGSLRVLSCNWNSRHRGVAWTRSSDLLLFTVLAWLHFHVLTLDVFSWFNNFMLHLSVRRRCEVKCVLFYSCTLSRWIRIVTFSSRLHFLNRTSIISLMRIGSNCLGLFSRIPILRSMRVVESNRLFMVGRHCRLRRALLRYFIWFGNSLLRLFPLVLRHVLQFGVFACLVCWVKLSFVVLNHEVVDWLMLSFNKFGSLVRFDRVLSFVFIVLRVFLLRSRGSRCERVLCFVSEFVLFLFTFHDVFSFCDLRSSWMFSLIVAGIIIDHNHLMIYQGLFHASQTQPLLVLFACLVKSVAQTLLHHFYLLKIKWSRVFLLPLLRLCLMLGFINWFELHECINVGF